jgi:hypothetical protein
MISGLLKPMRRLSLAGHQIESQVPCEPDCIIDNGLVSTEVRSTGSRPAHLWFCSADGGGKDTPVALASQIIQ